MSHSPSPTLAEGINEPVYVNTRGDAQSRLPIHCMRGRNSPLVWLDRTWGKGTIVPLLRWPWGMRKAGTEAKAPCHISPHKQDS